MSYTFTDRHIGPSNKDINLMLETLNVESLDALTKQTVPADILLDKNLDLSPAVKYPYSIHLSYLPCSTV